MSEQPITSLYEQHDRGDVLKHDNVNDFQKARENLRPYAQVRAEREATQDATEAAVHYSVEAISSELTIHDALIELSNLTKTRDEYLKGAA